MSTPSLSSIFNKTMDHLGEEERLKNWSNIRRMNEKVKGGNSLNRIWTSHKEAQTDMKES